MPPSLLLALPSAFHNWVFSLFHFFQNVLYYTENFIFKHHFRFGEVLMTKLNSITCKFLVGLFINAHKTSIVIKRWPDIIAFSCYIPPMISDEDWLVN